MREPTCEEGPLPTSDQHVHSQFSWDAPAGDMEASCRRALELGLRGIVFTEHADFVPEVHHDLRPLDIPAYRAEVERCRAIFPELRILLGVELGEPHRFPAEAAAVLAASQPERVLGSVHCVRYEDGVLDASQLRRLPAEAAPGFMRAYLQEVLLLVQSSQPFEVLAHLDYPRRYWPAGAAALAETDFEAEYRAVLAALARRDGVLEINTTRGIEPTRGLCPGPIGVGWWLQEGGRAVSFGSDAHSPEQVASGLKVARDLALGLGLRPEREDSGLWRR